MTVFPHALNGMFCQNCMTSGDKHDCCPQKRCFLFMCAVLNQTDGELQERDSGINMKKILKEKG